MWVNMLWNYWSSITANIKALFPPLIKIAKIYTMSHLHARIKYRVMLGVFCCIGSLMSICLTHVWLMELGTPPPSPPSRQPKNWNKQTRKQHTHNPQKKTPVKLFLCVSKYDKWQKHYCSSVGGFHSKMVCNVGLWRFRCFGPDQQTLPCSVSERHGNNCQNFAEPTWNKPILACYSCHHVWWHALTVIPSWISHHMSSKSVNYGIILLTYSLTSAAAPLKFIMGLIIGFNLSAPILRSSFVEYLTSYTPWMHLWYHHWCWICHISRSQ